MVLKTFDAFFLKFQYFCINMKSNVKCGAKKINVEIKPRKPGAPLDKDKQWILPTTDRIYLNLWPSG